MTQQLVSENPAATGARILDGRALATELRAAAAAEIAALQARHRVLPGLTVVLVGADPASLGYIRMILKTCAGIGLPAQLIELPATTTRGVLQSELARLNVLPEVAGVIVQMPLPPPLGPEHVSAVLDPAKDVDGIHPENAGRLALGYTGLDFFAPPTPQAGMALLRRQPIRVSGKSAVVIGRSPVVGRPLALMLLQENATVTTAHSHTPPEVLRRLLGDADIVASAVGRPNLVRGDMLKPGATVLDFGVSIVDGAMVGDVDFASAREVAGAITPVPGGIGPVTNVMLVRNTIKAIRHQLGE